LPWFEAQLGAREEGLGGAMERRPSRGQPVLLRQWRPLDDRRRRNSRNPTIDRADAAGVAPHRSRGNRPFITTASGPGTVFYWNSLFSTLFAMLGEADEGNNSSCSWSRILMRMQ